MKSLRDYDLKLTKTATDEALTFGPAFTPPIHATVNGLPIRVLNSANLPGASPVYTCVDANGFTTWVKWADVIITDGAFLPLHAEMTGTLTGSGSMR